MNKLFLTVVLSLTLKIATAQSISQHVFGSSGGYLAAANANISFTTSEPITQTIQNQNNALTQGFHQPQKKSSPKLNVFFPNAFTPTNGDNLNQTFKPVHNLTNFENYSLKIFNRWQMLIWQTNDINVGWDGTVNQQTAPDGIYIYEMNINLTNNKTPYAINGVIHLLK